MELLVEMPGAVPPPPETWLQCDACGKWRRLPSTTAAAEQPERWECSLNPEARGRGRGRSKGRGRGRGRAHVGQRRQLRHARTPAGQLCRVVGATLGVGVGVGVG